MKNKIPMLIEIGGMAITASGILIEHAKGLDLGYWMISIGGILIAGGSVLWSKVIRRT